MTEARGSDAIVPRLRLWLAADYLPLLIGLAILAIPTIISLGQQVWTSEAGAHGPIVAAVGVWLLARQVGAARPLIVRGSMALTSLGLACSLAIYVFGRAYDFISLEVAGLYGAAVSILYSRIGLRALAHIWFPVIYLAFLVPPPGWLMDQLTAPLKQFVSWASMTTLSAVGIPVSREGVTIYVAAYRLLVEDACSGMNSIVGLIAVSLLYIYLLRGSNLRYAILLVIATLPIAVLGNILRIMTLILLTYFAGDAVAQGFLHQAAGLFLFSVDLLLVFGLDQLLWTMLHRSRKAA
jgi:exosortase